MTIRKMLPNDKPVFIEMMQEFYSSDAVLHELPLSTIKRCFEDASGSCPYIVGYIFESGSDILGFALVSKGYSTESGGICIQIEDLFIRPGFRGSGAGREFLQYIENTYKENARRLRLEVEPKNTKAISLYKRMGFKELPYFQMIKDW